MAGAVFDIVCDRACSFLLAAAFMATFPATIGPLAIFLVQFGVLDTMLSLAFLLWPGTLSPNYFYKVDRPIWLWNWSKPAKAVNTAAVVISLIVAHHTGAHWLPYSGAIGALVVKVASTLPPADRSCRGRVAAVPAWRDCQGWEGVDGVGPWFRPGVGVTCVATVLVAHSLEVMWVWQLRAGGGLRDRVAPSSR